MLKDFHVVFIIASAVLAFGFGFWAISSHGHSAVTGLPPTPGEVDGWGIVCDSPGASFIA